MPENLFLYKISVSNEMRHFKEQSWFCFVLLFEYTFSICCLMQFLPIVWTFIILIRCYRCDSISRHSHLSSFRNYISYNAILLYETCYRYDSKSLSQVNTASSSEVFLSCLFFCYRYDSKIFRSNQFGCCTRNKPHLDDPSAIVAVAFRSIVTLSSFRNYFSYNLILLYENCYRYDSKQFWCNSCHACIRIDSYLIISLLSLRQQTVLARSRQFQHLN